MANYYAIITDIGNAQIANAIALGKTISLTHMAVGDANGSSVLPVPNQKSLVHETYRAQINSLTIDEENPNVVIAEFIIPEDIGGFYVRELGVFDNAGNLIAVGNTPESYKPKMTEGSGAQKVMRMHLVTSASDKIELKINPSIVVATIDLVNKKVDEINRTIQTKADKNHNHDTEYAKITHTHTIAQVTGLDIALTGKAATNHTHADLVPITRKINNKVLSADVSLTAADVGAAPASHTHTTAQVTGLDTALAGKAPTSHSHTTAQITGLDTALAGKAPTSHIHSDLSKTDASNITVDKYLQKLGLKEASLAANGWQKLPSGLIIQWGQVSFDLSLSSILTLVNLPISFPRFYVPFASYDDASHKVAEHNIRLNKLSLSSFEARWGNQINTKGAFWFAIGY